MNKEQNIDFQLKKAKTDTRIADELIRQYLPFIKSETAKFIKSFPDENQDELSIAMFAFYESIMAYKAEKGSFFKFASVAIRNRLIDYYRKEQKHRGILSLDASNSNDDTRTLAEQIPDVQNDEAVIYERIATQKEIQDFSDQLNLFGLTLSDIADNCPKQERTYSVCMDALDYAKQNPEILEQFVRTKKLPMTQLTTGINAERKTLGRHRKYIVALLLAYTNGFEIIRGHLKMMKRKEVSRV